MQGILLLNDLHPSSKNMTANMSDICKKMKTEGFDFCSLATCHALQHMVDPKLSNQPKLEGSVKPGQCTWFSPIQPMWSGDDEEYSKDVWGTAWSEWLREEDYEVEEYSRKDLLFAKFTKGRLANGADQRFKKAGEFRDERGYFHVPRWGKVASQYGGIHVDLSTNNDVFPGWDIETVCVWDPTVFTEIQWFPNSGKPWEYEVLY